MDDLTIVSHNGILYADSREVAEVTDIRHADLLRKIGKYVTVLENAKLRSQGFFILSNYKVNGNNKVYDRFLITKKGCDMVANKMTGNKGIIFTAKYIDKFYEMERNLLERNSPYWQQTRIESKSNRRMETDEIKLFIQYAKDNDSKSADKYYIHFSNMANKAVGIERDSRDVATINQLNNIVLVESIIGNVIKEGIKQSLCYKDIFKMCKSRIEQFRQIVYLQKTA